MKSGPPRCMRGSTSSTRRSRPGQGRGRGDRVGRLLRTALRRRPTRSFLGVEGQEPGGAGDRETTSGQRHVRDRLPRDAWFTVSADRFTAPVSTSLPRSHRPPHWKVRLIADRHPVHRSKAVRARLETDTDRRLIVEDDLLNVLKHTPTPFTGEHDGGTLRTGSSFRVSTARWARAGQQDSVKSCRMIRPAVTATCLIRGAQPAAVTMKS